MCTLEYAWEFYRASFEVLSAVIEMLLFPVMSGAAALAVAPPFSSLSTRRACWINCPAERPPGSFTPSSLLTTSPYTP